MAKHNDATGYLLAYRDSVGEPWFNAICEYAIQSAGIPLLPDQLQGIWDYYQGAKAFSPTASAPPALAQPPGVPIQPFYLECLFGFSDFKRLSPSLKLDLSKRVTLIFGRNGAGKSSLCQAFKILSNPEAPKEPLTNARSRTKALPSFSYKFKDSAKNESWSELDGFGVKAHALKYFDSTIALKHATGAITPENVVELSAFRLECFDYARNHIKQFQQFSQEKINNTRQATNQKIQDTKFKVSTSIDITAGLFADWSAENYQPMASWIGTIQPHTAAQKLERQSQQLHLDQLIAATSIEGQKALSAQQTLIGQFSNTLKLISSTCTTYSPAIYLSTVQSISQKEAASIELSSAAFPTGKDHQAHSALLFAANTPQPLVSATNCPLCLQELTEQASTLFKNYHNFLTSNLQTEITQLKQTKSLQANGFQKVRALLKPDTSPYKEIFDSGFITSLEALLTAIFNAIRSETITPESTTNYSRHLELEHYTSHIDQIHNQITETITQAVNDAAKTQQLIEKLRSEIASDKRNEAAHSAKQEIEKICDESRIFEESASRYLNFNFSPRMTALTTKMKEAHSELVLGSFIPHLDAEYKRLCGSSLEQMGVKLANQGSEAIVIPKVGDSPVHRVLSEGEQKVHALALFMCEATATPHQVLVLDDPVTSFDYNYVSNFCERLRDYIRDHQTAQLIILTHNWDFFTNLQQVINRSNLGNFLSVQVLEDCSTVSEYVERWDELCTEIETITSMTTEPSGAQKEELSGLLRRLIERLTNGFVFNDQRHQYKPKQLQISAFHAFMKLVPLLQSEADKLRDLYANLSPTEHDDIRNFYLSKTLSQFNLWYNDIKNMKLAIEARRPK